MQLEDFNHNSNQLKLLSEICPSEMNNTISDLKSVHYIYIDDMRKFDIYNQAILVKS